MAATRNTRSNQPRTGAFGLLANGSCGPWEIAIDEDTTAADRWCAHIEGPNATFYFEIPALEIVDQMARFLERSAGAVEQNGSLVLGKDHQIPITLIRDDEYGDRFFLVVGSTSNPIVRFVLAGTDVVNLVGALRQVKADLDDEG